MGALAVGALGIVFGDIGTSPLYAFREALGDEALAIDERNVLGVLSLMFWSLIIVITLKYVVLVMRADNHGEGGILALTALVSPERRGGERRGLLIMLGLFGTALLYGDGMITPAISVLSAVEGIGVAAPSIQSWIVPIVVAILIGLFAVQHRGTAAIGRFFGPVMVIWFSTLVALGVAGITKDVSVFRALDPTRAIVFFAHNGLDGYLVLGTVFLVVTGGEALYADMGHFGRRPIALGWFFVVLPALMINYFGQGALLLSDPTAIENPFYLLAPTWARWPLTVLSTGATVIASQALITGAFSLTVQASNLGYLPRINAVETSSEHRGQVFVPAVNWMLLIACVTLVVAFGSSSALAAAYGVAVTMTMVITTLLIGRVASQRWGWKTPKIAVVLVPLLIIDVAFLGANLFKIPDGGWFPLVIGAIGFVIFTTWARGRTEMGNKIAREGVSLADFVESLQADPPHRHPGTAVYLHSRPGRVPPALLANLRHNAALHETVVVTSVLVGERPHVLPAGRAEVTAHPLGFYQVLLHYGFTDPTPVAADLERLDLRIDFRAETTTYFLGRERIEPTDEEGMAGWRERMFTFLHRNAADPTDHFGLPPDRSVDIGTHVDL